MNCCKVSDFFSGKFCIRLCFPLENGCAALKVQSPLTSGAIWYIKGFPYPVGKFTNKSLPLRNSATAFSCRGLRFWTPNVKHTPETTFTFVALARDFLHLHLHLHLQWTREVWQYTYSNYSRRANKLTRQPIRTTSRFSGSDVTGQYYRPVPSDVSLPRLSKRRRRLKFRLYQSKLLSNFWKYFWIIDQRHWLK